MKPQTPPTPASHYWQVSPDVLMDTQRRFVASSHESLRVKTRVVAVGSRSNAKT